MGSGNVGFGLPGDRHRSRLLGSYVPGADLATEPPGRRPGVTHGHGDTKVPSGGPLPVAWWQAHVPFGNGP